MIQGLQDMPRKAVATRAGTPAAVPDLLTDLQRLGFSEYEARTYLSLLQGHPATAYEVSKHSGLPRANTYGALESLTKKQAVQPVSETPVRYVPITPAVLLDRLSSEVSTVCGRLKEGLSTVAVRERSDVVWTVSGQKPIEKKIDELIDGAQQHIWIKASTDVLRQHTQRLKRAAGRGVKLLFVVFGDDTSFLNFGRNSKVYLHEGNGARMGGADNLFTITSDFRIALTANVSGELTGAYTTNELIVRMAETLIRHDFYMAEILTAFGPDIEARFGAHLTSLRRQLFSQEQYTYLMANMAAAGQS